MVHAKLTFSLLSRGILTSQGKEVDMIHPLGKFACKLHMKQMDICLERT